ncbi:F-box protein [Candidatus Berkiella aquae]|uniref:F-box domain-containing protein n=1 Tax=Candidatus Berkiella aquae TaxID=295108 RepID=A0A0Q9YDT8_9GAMM|nr:F-box protein [Candidatus Berkiella aquae]MCS5709927.1 hypothetical protein [Candidatus Berkiella aquae]
MFFRRKKHPTKTEQNASLKKATTFNDLVDDLKMVVFDLLDSSDLLTVHRVCHTWNSALLSATYSPWSYRLNHDFPTSYIPMLKAEESRNRLVQNRHYCFNTLSIVSQDKEGAPYVFSALEGKLDAINQASIKMDTKNRLFALALANGCKAAAQELHKSIHQSEEAYQLLAYEIAVRFNNVEIMLDLIEELEPNVKKFYLTEMLFYTKKHAVPQTFLIALTAILKKCYQLQDTALTVQDISLALEGHIEKIDPNKWQGRVKKILWMLALAHNEPHALEEKCDSALLQEFFIFTCLFQNMKRIPYLMGDRENEFPIFYCHVMSSAFRNGELDLAALILSLVKQKGLYAFRYATKQAVDYLAVQYDFDKNFVSLLKNEFKLTEFSIFSANNFLECLRQGNITLASIILEQSENLQCPANDLLAAVETSKSFHSINLNDMVVFLILGNPDHDPQDIARIIKTLIVGNHRALATAFIHHLDMAFSIEEAEDDLWLIDDFMQQYVLNKQLQHLSLIDEEPQQERASRKHGNTCAIQ